MQVFILKNWEGDADEGDDGGDEDEEKAENPAADAADNDEKSNRGKMATTSCWFSHCIIFAL
eukprot:COSAG01_NODE_27548_length_683_cov_0.619863_1_plen_62_part_00